MPSMDATLTWALPVEPAPLLAHTRAYVSTLPALNTLRACNRFGTGPHCHITKLPVELVEAIANYHVVTVRNKELKKCRKLFRCYEDQCSLLDHRSRKELLDIYHEVRQECDDDCCCGFPNEPTKEQLETCLAECEFEEYSYHDDNRDAWQARVKECESNERPLLQKHFGIDIWLSSARLGGSERFRSPADTTIAYLTLPDRVVCKEEWPRFIPDYDTYQPAQNGSGMAVAIDDHPTPKELQNFKRATKALDLEVLAEKFSSKNILSLASTKKDQVPVEEETAASLPRPMLLVRNNMEGE